MKPLMFQVAERISEKPKAKAPLKRIWLKVEGKLECRWVEDRR